MKRRMGRVAGIGLALASVVLLIEGCNTGPVTVTTRPQVPIRIGEIRRIAVVPFTTTGLALDRVNEVGAEPLAEPPGDTVTQAVLTAMRGHTEWQLVDQLTVGEAIRQLYGEVRPPTPAEAVAVGRVLHADAVLRGNVRVFEERIGSELAARRPARVVFAVELLRIPDGVAIWQAEYSERQQSLSENLLNLPGFIRAGGTWVRASELAQLGATQLVRRLYVALYGPPSTRRATS